MLHIITLSQAHLLTMSICHCCHVAVCDTINASYELLISKDISIVDLYSDNMHNAPFMHQKNMCRLIYKIDFYMSICGSSEQTPLRIVIMHATNYTVGLTEAMRIKCLTHGLNMLTLLKIEPTLLYNGKYTFYQTNKVIALRCWR